MDFISVPGASLACRRIGAGPALLAPECNFTWAPQLLEMMAESFTVIIGSPRGFGASSRTGPSYDPDLWASDMLAMAHHYGHESFMVFGYSFTGAFGPWLALKLGRTSPVVAVASGGFPLLGDYGVTFRDVDTQMRRLAEHDELWQQYDRQFDPHAVWAFSRDVAALPADSLVSRIRCPLYCFWGDQDTDVVGLVMRPDELGSGLTAYGVPWKEYSGYGHGQLNADPFVAWPDTQEWLLRQHHEWQPG